MESCLFFILVIFSFTNIISPATYTCNPNSSCGCSAGSTVVTSRIVGGEQAPVDAWNWMVSLSRGGSHRCGASLISASYAITAAHCVEGYVSTPSVFTIMVGTNYLYDSTSTTIQRRTVTNIIKHPNYNTNTEENDIAILKFSALTISDSSKLSFICLPAANVDPFTTNTNLIATGWGYTSENSYSASEYLRQVTVQVFSSTSSDCIQGGIENSNVQFCAGVTGGGKDTCQGDSGGPLMAFMNNVWVLAGVTSYGYGCARAGYPGVYTRVSAFVPFINSNTGVNITTTSPELSSSSSTSRASTMSTADQASTTGSIIVINHGKILCHSLTIMITCLLFLFVILKEKQK